MRLVGLIWIGFFLLVMDCPISYGNAQAPRKDGMIIETAVVSESIQDFRPVNPGVAFSIETGRIVCFTRFDAIPADTFIWHRWYRKDDLVTEQKLMLEAPRWATYSRIQLREFDKGPWRVEIVDPDNQVLTTLRFSVTE